MKKILTFLLVLLSTQLLLSQKFEGKWLGTLTFSGTQLRLIFNISKTENGYSSTLDSPDQGATGIPVTQTTITNSVLHLEIPAAKLSYTGELKNDTIIGTFKQNGKEFEMNLSKSIIESTELKRPQEPKAPYDYYSEEVTFENKKENVLLSGTLTLPKKEGNYPVVILISGSGPQNRNEELFGHKPFLVLSDYLTKNGIAVLRYDDRGVGKSTGNFTNATSADFATDVNSAIEFLKTRKDIIVSKIGLVGHSEGGLIAPMVASKNKDINFIVLLAAPGLRGAQVLLLQKEKIERTMGIPETAIEEGQRIFSELYKMIYKKEKAENLKTYLKSQLNTKSKDAEEVDAIIDQLDSKWMRFYVNYDPYNAINETKCAVLALNGENDLQVPYKENLDKIQNTLQKSRNNNFKIKSYPKLNHLFQTSTTGSLSEYITIEETFSPNVLQDISDWILKQVN